MDTLGSLALATEPPTEALLDRQPHSRDEYIISRNMFKHIIGQSIYQVIVLLILVFAGEFFIPEFVDELDSSVFAGRPELKFHEGVLGGNIRSGRFNFVDGSKDYATVFD